MFASVVAYRFFFVSSCRDNGKTVGRRPGASPYAGASPRLQHTAARVRCSAAYHLLAVYSHAFFSPITLVMSESDSESTGALEKGGNGFTASPKTLSRAGSAHDHVHGNKTDAVDEGHAAGPDEDEEDVEEDESDDYEEDEEEEDEEEDEDEDEPALKYERFGGVLHDLLQKDSASAVAYANKRLVCYHDHLENNC